MIILQQEKGDSLAEKKPKITAAPDGPVRSKTVSGRKNLGCEGLAIDIRKSMERVLPKSANPKPRVRGKIILNHTTPGDYTLTIP